MKVSGDARKEQSSRRLLWQSILACAVVVSACVWIVALVIEGNYLERAASIVFCGLFSATGILLGAGGSAAIRVRVWARLLSAASAWAAVWVAIPFVVGRVDESFVSQGLMLVLAPCAFACGFVFECIALIGEPGKRRSVIGAGSLGFGIALLFAAAVFAVQAAQGQFLRGDTNGAVDILVLACTGPAFLSGMTRMASMAR